MIYNFFKKGAALVIATLVMGAFSNTALAIPAGWTCTGSCGTLGADGVVTAPPNGDATYDWVSTSGGAPQGDFIDLNIGSETNGSNLLSTLFSADAGDSVEFDFNYVTSDGTLSFIEYAWAQVLDELLDPVALLFTARTNPDGNAVPGFGLPPITATINPPSTPILDGTEWSPLGTYSGSCFGGVGNGCGHTGWINSSYDIEVAGNYYLLFGVTNWGDQIYDSGMAISGATIGGDPIELCDDGSNPPCDQGDDDVVPVSEPSIIALFAAGLFGLGFARRRMRS